jgi:pSer/pThr/pTyr-binding forkhead associated (FHA) protein
MLVILESVSGPITGRRIEIRGGSIVRIGRTGKSDHAIAEDSYLSGLHFSAECDGTQCRIRDLGSSNGTFVNGARISEQVVQAGDSIVAGGSTFRIHIDLLPDITGVGIPSLKTAATPVSTASRTMADTPGYSNAELTLLNAPYGSGEHVLAMIDVSRDFRPCRRKKSMRSLVPASE